MAYLRCPECRLTVPATAYYLRGDQCPRCMTTMEPAERFRGESVSPSAAPAAAAAMAETPVRPAASA
jgi:hypothetical protein